MSGWESALDRLLVELGRLLVVLLLVRLVGGLEGLLRLQLADLGAPTPNVSDPRASTAAIASDAPDKDRIEPPTNRENCRGRNRASIVKQKNVRQGTVYYWFRHRFP